MAKINLVLVILLFIVATLISMQAIFHASPVAIGRYFIAQIGSTVGVTVSVPSNPFNTLAQQLKEKESTLFEKEKKLQEKEIALDTEINKGQSSQNKIFMYLAAMGGILLLLILLNFYFDYRRKH